MAKKSFKDSLWPTVETKEAARAAAMQGFWAALIVAGITAIFAIIAIALGPVAGVPIDGWSFLDVGIFVAIAIYIRKLSRVAAVAGLVVYWINRIIFWAMTGFQANSFTGLWLVVLLTLAFINGIRGTFAYHRLTAQSLAGATPVDGANDTLSDTDS